MADYTKILQELAEIRERIGRIETEVAQMQQTDVSSDTVGAAPPAAAGKNLQPEAQGEGAAGRIPPLVLDEADQIMGGTITDGFPDCCAIGNEFMGYFCTGTLIAKNLVLTAKHCARQYNVTRVFLKGNDVNKPEQGETINVTQVYQHPDKNVDLMALRLEHDATVDERPIARGAKCKGKTALVVGFGRIDDQGTKGYGRKRKAGVPIKSLDCSTIDEQAQYGCRDGIEMVAGHRGLKKDTCQGDSGGPLYIEDDLGNRLLLGVTLRGVRSPEDLCGNGGIYLRADKFIKWIEDQTGIKLKEPKD